MRKLDGNKYRDRISFQELGLLGIVCLSFCVQIFVYIFNSIFLFLLVAALLTFLVMVAKPIVINRSQFGIQRFWLVSLLVIAISYINGIHSWSNYADLIVFFCCILLMLCCPYNTGLLEKCIKVIEIIGVIYAVTVWIQLFLPGIYKQIMIHTFGTEIFGHVDGLRIGGYLAGFTPNPGFVAGHISVSLFAYICFREQNSYKGKNLIQIVFLLLSLMLTGKRGHLLFVILCCVLVYLSASNNKKRGRLWKVFFFFTFVIILFMVFKDLLGNIPIVSRLVDTISQLLLGEDITNGRSKMYVWAIENFKNHPIFGIGWGQAKAMSQGSVLITKSMDIHNVYLQLLCETGLLGFLIVVPTMLFCFIKTRKCYLSLSNNNASIWTKLLKFSMMYQFFFLLYCFSGNPLYDHNYRIMYLFCCIITVAFLNSAGNLEV